MLLSFTTLEPAVDLGLSCSVVPDEAFDFPDLLDLLVSGLLRSEILGVIVSI
jgi:hypothetical protein